MEEKNMVTIPVMEYKRLVAAATTLELAAAAFWEKPEGALWRDALFAALFRVYRPEQEKE